MYTTWHSVQVARERTHSLDFSGGDAAISRLEADLVCHRLCRSPISQNHQHKLMWEKCHNDCNSPNSFLARQTKLAVGLVTCLSYVALAQTCCFHRETPPLAGIAFQDDESQLRIQIRNDGVFCCRAELADNCRNVSCFGDLEEMIEHEILGRSGKNPATHQPVRYS